MILLSLSLALAADGLVPVRGVLFEADGVPLNGTRTMVFSLWHDDAATTPFWEDDLAVSLEDGVFFAQLGSDRSLDLAALGAHPNAAFSVRIVGDVDSDRVAVGWAPRAGWAHDAGHLGGRPPEDYRLAEDSVDWDEISDKPDFDGTYLAQGDAASTYLPLAGGAMTGALSLSGAPTSASHAATKAYVDGAVSPYLTSALATTTYLPLAGGSLSGALTLPGAPTAANHAATKAYVDTAVGTVAYLPLAGGTLTGAVTLPAEPPTSANHAASKGYVDGALTPYLTSALASSSYVARDGSGNVSIVGNLGVGTTTPQRKLEVNGSARIAGNGILEGGVEQWSLGTSSYKLWDGNQLGLGTYDTKPIEFATNNARRMFIGGTGNVGVGTTTPGAKLDVNGNLNVSGTIKASHPYFTASATDCWRDAPASAWTEVVWNTTTAGNAGGWLNTSNGRFTAPVAGVYLFTMQIYNYGASDSINGAYFHINFGVDGSVSGGGGQAYDGSYSIVSNQYNDYDQSTEISRFLVLNAGQYVSVQIYNGGPVQRYMCGYHSSFQGVLLQAL
jgi:hypothetical protein